MFGNNNSSEDNFNNSAENCSDDIYLSEDNDYIMPPKRQLSKQPATAKKMVEDDVDDKPPFVHKQCDVIRVVYNTRNLLDVTEVTITVNSFVNPTTYKIDLVSKGSALLFH